MHSAYLPTYHSTNEFELAAAGPLVNRMTDMSLPEEVFFSIRPQLYPYLRQLSA